MPRPRKAAAIKFKAKAASPLREMENAFHTAKAKLASQYAKELSTLTKDFAKVKKAVSQLQAKKKVAKNRRVAAMKRFKGDTTKAAKNQIKAAKSLYDAGVAALNEVQMQASQFKGEIQRVKFAHQRFGHALKAMAKAEMMVEKNWLAMTKKGRRRRTKKASATTA